MAYTTGGLIEAADYNGFVTTINNVWGVGTGDSGYGQSTTLSSVVTGNTVTATQWATLIQRIDSLRNHQNLGAPGSGIAQPTAGTVITRIATLQTQITNVNDNRLSNAGDGNGTNIATGTLSVVNSTAWTTVRTQEISLTWGSYNQMRYFFNTGGYVTVSAIGSLFSGNTKSTQWNTLADNFGTLRLNAQTSAKEGGLGVLSTNQSALGFYDLTDVHQTFFEQFDTLAAYNTNYITCQFRLNVPHASAPTILYCKIIYTDASTDIVDDDVLGTAQIDVTARPSGVTYIANTWGAVTAASVTNT